jgi:hypothetical protein
VIRIRGLIGEVERWRAGVLESWSAGVLECWSAGVLECWSAGARVFVVFLVLVLVLDPFALITLKNR